jgi:hypothetical protein
MNPWSERKSDPAIGAQLPSSGVSTGGHGKAQPHEGSPRRAGLWTLLRRRPRASGLSTPTQVPRTYRVGAPRSMSTFPDCLLLQTCIHSGTPAATAKPRSLVPACVHHDVDRAPGEEVGTKTDRQRRQPMWRLRPVTFSHARISSSSLPPDFPGIKTGKSIGATRPICQKSACIAALQPMMPWNEARSATAIDAHLRPAGVSTRGHRNTQPHEGYRAGRWALPRLDCGPLAAMPSSHRASS